MTIYSILNGLLKPRHLYLVEDESFRWVPDFNERNLNDSTLRYHFILNGNKPMELSVRLEERVVTVSFLDKSKPQKRMNKEDIWRAIAMSKKCMHMKAVLRAALPPLYEIQLCDETKFFLKSKLFVFMAKWRFDSASFKQKIAFRNTPYAKQSKTS